MRPCVRRASPVVYRVKRTILNLSYPDNSGQRSVSDLPGFSRDFDCFDSILEWDGISGMEVVFDSLIFFAVLIV